VANRGDKTVSQYDVDASGAQVPKSRAAVVAGNGPDGIAVSPDGRSVYVVNNGDGTVEQYNVNTDGSLTPKRHATVAAGLSPKEIAVSPDGKGAYVTGCLDPVGCAKGIVSECSIGAGGGLTHKKQPTIAADFVPTSVGITPDGHSVASQTAATARSPGTRSARAECSRPSRRPRSSPQASPARSPSR
jgi:DNA-binding beta-propeller fold protein YncE